MLLDSGLKLSDVIVTLCSKLLDYILLKSGSKYKKCHVFKLHLRAYASLHDKTRFGQISNQLIERIILIYNMSGFGQGKHY